MRDRLSCFLRHMQQERNCVPSAAAEKPTHRKETIMFKQSFKPGKAHPIRNALLATAIAIGLGGANAASAASADYYIEYSFSFSLAYATTSVTVDGQTLVKPNGACGMRFEYPENADWLVPVYGDIDTRSHGHINVWLPSDDCGAWPNVVLEADDDDDGNDITSPPYSVPGTLRVLDAYAYWIDSGGNKLVYKYCCGKDYVYGNEFKALERQAPAELGAIKRLLRGGSTTGALTEQLATSEQTLRTISRELSYAIAQRRTQFVDKLERSVRRLEDDATAAVNAALAAQASCRNSAKAGDSVGAFLACDAALDAVKQAGAAADTAHNWLR
jgi:hypothetical protein